jgi:hypothetical protein
MSASADSSRRGGSRRTTIGVITCPACGGPLKPDSKWCPACEFTGSHTLDLYPDDPPPLLPVLDAVGLLNESDIRKIGSARESLRRRFPQFHWRICLVNLPADASLPVFGFWLLNACPMHDGESVEDRAWTILLLIDDASGEAAVIPGYGAEPFVSDDEWKSVLAPMSAPWRAGKPADAIVCYFREARTRLDLAWKRFGSRRNGRNSP